MCCNIKILPRYPYGTVWISAHTNQPNPRVYYQGVRTTSAETQWAHLCRNTKSHVWPQTVRQTCKWPTDKKHHPIRIITMQAYHRPLEAQVEAHHLLAGFWRLWRKIRHKIACGLFNGLHQKNYPVSVDCTGGLYCGIKLDWFHAWIHEKRNDQAPTQTTKMGNKCPTPMGKTKLLG